MDLAEQLRQGAERLLQKEFSFATCHETNYRLRTDQVSVFQEFANYLQDLVTRPGLDHLSPFCRIILPPRTGKTVIAGHIIAMTGLSATIIVPTRALVIQTAEALKAQMNGSVPLGVFYSGEKQVVSPGINVITYASLQIHSKQGSLPGAIKMSALIFVDEAHHSMTKLRMKVLNHAFDPWAVRIALTATPKYNEAKQLDHFFPDKIHEIDLFEAMSLGLLAPVRVWVAEVDTGRSRVRMIAGDFEKATLGRLMSTAPFFKTVEIFRYSRSNHHIPCLIVCASRQQAYDLQKYLEKYRPVHHPGPGLILGETPDKRRNQLLAAFDQGKIDTLIQVGVLIEGWDSPICKLLIDLAPSTSKVRATQKYFRVMTQYQEKEAKIYVILPEKLPRHAILPMDLLLRNGDEYRCGNMINSQKESDPLRPLDTHLESPVKGVVVKKRILVGGARLELPRLKPDQPDQVRRVLESCPGFDPGNPCIRKEFIGLRFYHPLFTGSGKTLLGWLGVGYVKNAFWIFLAKLYPETTGYFFLIKNSALRVNEASLMEIHHSCQKDVDYFKSELLKSSEDGRPEDPFPEILSMLQGGTREGRTPEQLLLDKEEMEQFFNVLATIENRYRQVVIWRLGLDEPEPLTYLEIAQNLDLSRERARQIVSRGLRMVRHRLARRDREEALSRSLLP